MRQRHGDGFRLFPGHPGLAARRLTITRELAVTSTFTGPGEFGPLFPGAEAFQPEDKRLEVLGRKMEDVSKSIFKPEDKSGDNRQIPAGYTYFGQFVDHDMTFDRMGRIPEEAVDPETLGNLRTPGLDLDSLYGLGPKVDKALYDPQSPVERARFRFGETVAVNDEGKSESLPVLPFDLFRADKRLATIADSRNDENLIIAQMHLAFQRFHNKVLDDIEAKQVAPLGGGTPFDEARRLVTWHYQWLVLEDFLPRLLDTDELAVVRRDGPQHYRWNAQAGGRPFMPLEFSVAAYRMGHSMIRQGYDYNRIFNFDRNNLARLGQMFLNTGPGGQVPLKTRWIIDWRRFFELSTTIKPNPSRLLNTLLANLLKSLPQFKNTDDQPESLAMRNLLRGSRVGLPSGQTVAARLGIEPLSPEILRGGPVGEAVVEQGFVEQTPLWYYILREAEATQDGLRLGRMGSRIVAEVIVGLLQSDPDAFLRAQPDFKPTLGPVPNRFSMADMLAYTYGENVNPLGD